MSAKIMPEAMLTISGGGATTILIDKNNISDVKDSIEHGGDASLISNQEYETSDTDVTEGITPSSTTTTNQEHGTSDTDVTKVITPPSIASNQHDGASVTVTNVVMTSSTNSIQRGPPEVVMVF